MENIKNMFQTMDNYKEMMETNQIMKELFPEGENPMDNDFFGNFANMSGMNMNGFDMSQIMSMFQGN